MRKLLCVSCFSLSFGIAAGQQPVSLDIEINNGVFYTYDTSDFTKFATVSGNVPVWSPSGGAFARNFLSGVFIADIVSVNGAPTRGVMARRGNSVQLRPNPTPGQAIADVTRSFIDDGVWELQQVDGTPIGAITTHGFIGGTPPPGAPPAATGTNLAVTGGTGAFLGVRGQVVGAPVTGSAGSRVMASITEDPAGRRANGGNRSRFLFQLLPVTRPEIVSTATGLAIVHAGDGQPVTAANPASRGEALTLYARGLGATKPSIEAGQAFPPTPAFLVNSPVEITANGSRVEVLYAAGFAGAMDVYQVNFRLPEGVASGAVSLQLSSAWIAGNPVEIMVR